MAVQAAQFAPGSRLGLGSDGNDFFTVFLQLSASCVALSNAAVQPGRSQSCISAQITRTLPIQGGGPPSNNCRSLPLDIELEEVPRALLNLEMFG